MTGQLFFSFKSISLNFHSGNTPTSHDGCAEQTPQLFPTATTPTTTATHYLGLSALGLTNSTQMIKTNHLKGNIWQSIGDQSG